MKKSNSLALIIALTLTTGYMPFAEAQASDFEDAEYSVSGVQPIINAGAAYALGYTGKGVTVGVTDLPINFLNPEFNKKTSSYMANQGIYKNGAPGVYPWDSLDHGTHVAGIVAADRNGIGMQGVAYDAEIIGSCSGSQYLESGDFYVSDTLYDCYLTRPDVKVINNSWGGSDYMDEIMGDIAEADYTKCINDYVEKMKDYRQIVSAEKQDKLLLFAAGNSGKVEPTLSVLSGTFNTASAYNMLSVTSLDDANTLVNSTIQVNPQSGNLLANYSNLTKYAEDFALAAPGENILSANANFAQSGDLDVLMSGTSMAAPVVTGVGALVQQAYPYMSAKQIADVLLSTANSNVSGPSVGISCTIQMDWDEKTKTTIYQGNVFVLDSSLKSLSQAELATRYKDYLLKKYDQGLGEWLLARCKATNIYYDVPLQELIGQGVVDAGAAVKGPGALNARRLTAADISNQYTVAGTTTKQALYTIDTQGYDSVWSNDIKEIKAGYIAADSTEADLLERYTYYDTNWLSYTGTDRDAAKIVTKAMMDLYNQRAKDSGLVGLSVGLCKVGAGKLTMMGNNTYKGSSIAANGTLAIDGSVTGDAWSIQDSSAGMTGTLTGKGSIGGNLYNEGILQPSAEGNLTVKGNLKSTGSIGLVTTDSGQSARQIVVGGTAKVDGSVLVPVNGNLYLPKVNYSFLTAAGGITGTMTTAFSGLLNAELTASADGRTETAVLRAADNVGGLQEGQLEALRSLEQLSVNTFADSAKRSQVQALLLSSGDTARTALQSVANNMNADSAALTISSTAAMSAIGARASYLHSTGTLSGASRARAEEETTKSSRIIPLEVSPTTSGWLKFSKSWERLGHGTTSGQGYTTSIGFDHKVNADWKVGEFLSYGKNGFQTSTSTLDNSDTRLGIYGIREHGADQTYVYFDAGRQNNTGRRSVTSVEGSYTAASRYQSRTLELGAEYSHDIDYGKTQSWHRKPYVAAQVVRYQQDGFTESGAGAWNQQSAAENVTYSALSAGMGVERRTANDEVELRLGVKHVLTGSDPSTPVSFADAGGQTFTVRGSNLDKNLLVVGVHAGQEQEDGWRLEGDLALERGHSEQNIQASVMLKKTW